MSYIYSSESITLTTKGSPRYSATPADFSAFCVPTSVFLSNKINYIGIAQNTAVDTKGYQLGVYNAMTGAVLAKSTSTLLVVPFTEDDEEEQSVEYNPVLFKLSNEIDSSDTENIPGLVCAFYKDSAPDIFDKAKVVSLSLLCGAVAEEKANTFWGYDGTSDDSTIPFVYIPYSIIESSEQTGYYEYNYMYSELFFGGDLTISSYKEDTFVGNYVNIKDLNLISFTKNGSINFKHDNKRNAAVSKNLAKELWQQVIDCEEYPDLDSADGWVKLLEFKMDPTWIWTPEMSMPEAFVRPNIGADGYYYYKLCGRSLPDGRLEWKFGNFIPPATSTSDTDTSTDEEAAEGDPVATGIFIGGKELYLPSIVPTDDSTAAEQVANVINAEGSGFSVTAEAFGSRINLTAKVEGEAGNDITLSSTSTIEKVTFSGTSLVYGSDTHKVIDVPATGASATIKVDDAAHWAYSGTEEHGLISLMWTSDPDDPEKTVVVAELTGSTVDEFFNELVIRDIVTLDKISETEAIVTIVPGALDGNVGHGVITDNSYWKFSTYEEGAGNDLENYFTVTPFSGGIDATYKDQPALNATGWMACADWALFNYGGTVVEEDDGASIASSFVTTTPTETSTLTEAPLRWAGMKRSKTNMLQITEADDSVIQVDENTYQFGTDETSKLIANCEPIYLGYFQLSSTYSVGGQFISIYIDPETEEIKASSSNFGFVAKEYSPAWLLFASVKDGLINLVALKYTGEIGNVPGYGCEEFYGFPPSDDSAFQLWLSQYFYTPTEQVYENQGTEEDPEYVPIYTDEELATGCYNVPSPMWMEKNSVILPGENIGLNITLCTFKDGGVTTYDNRAQDTRFWLDNKLFRQYRWQQTGQTWSYVPVDDSKYIADLYRYFSTDNLVRGSAIVPILYRPSIDTTGYMYYRMTASAGGRCIKCEQPTLSTDGFSPVYWSTDESGNTTYYDYDYSTARYISEVLAETTVTPSNIVVSNNACLVFDTYESSLETPITMATFAGDANLFVAMPAETAVVSANMATSFTGTLILQNTLNVGEGDAPGNVSSIGSFSKIILDDKSKIVFNNYGDIVDEEAGTTTPSFNGVTVEADKTAMIHLKDTGPGSTVTLSGTTTVNGNLALARTWGSASYINSLTGSGNLYLIGADTSSNVATKSAELCDVYLLDEDSFTGSIYVKNARDILHYGTNFSNVDTYIAPAESTTTNGLNSLRGTIIANNLYLTGKTISGNMSSGTADATLIVDGTCEIHGTITNADKGTLKLSGTFRVYADDLTAYELVDGTTNTYYAIKSSSEVVSVAGGTFKILVGDTEVEATLDGYNYVFTAEAGEAYEVPSFNPINDDPANLYAPEDFIIGDIFSNDLKLYTTPYGGGVDVAMTITCEGEPPTEDENHWILPDGGSGGGDGDKKPKPTPPGSVVVTRRIYEAGDSNYVILKSEAGYQKDYPTIRQYSYKLGMSSVEASASGIMVGLNLNTYITDIQPTYQYDSTTCTMYYNLTKVNTIAKSDYRQPASGNYESEYNNFYDGNSPSVTGSCIVQWQNTLETFTSYGSKFNTNDLFIVTPVYENLTISCGVYDGKALYVNESKYKISAKVGNVKTIIRNKLRKGEGATLTPEPGSIGLGSYSIKQTASVGTAPSGTAVTPPNIWAKVASAKFVGSGTSSSTLPYESKSRCIYKYSFEGGKKSAEMRLPTPTANNSTKWNEGTDINNHAEFMLYIDPPSTSTVKVTISSTTK